MSSRTYYIVRNNYHAKWYFQAKELVLQEGGCNSTEEKINSMFIYSEGNRFYEFFTGECLGTIKSESIFYILSSEELGEIGVTSHKYGSDSPDLTECSASSFKKSIEQYLPRQNEIRKRIQTIFDKRKLKITKNNEREAKAKSMKEHNNVVDDEFLSSIIESRKEDDKNYFSF